MPKKKISLRINEDGTYSKYCLTCKNWKNIIDFGIRKGKSDGFCEKCKDCYHKAEEQRRRSRGIQPRPYHPPNYEENNIIYKWCLHCKRYLPTTSFNIDVSRSDKLSLYCKEYDRNKKKEQQKNITFREQKRTYCIQYRKNNLEKIRQKEYDYRKNNLASCHLREKRYRDRKKDDFMYKLNIAMRGGIYRSLKNQKAGLHWENLVPYDITELTTHLSSQFIEGMTLDNYGTGEGRWNIDHIRAISTFSFKCVTDVGFQECWQLKNLRPVWATENTRKSSTRDILLEQTYGLIFSY